MIPTEFVAKVLDPLAAADPADSYIDSAVPVRLPFELPGSRRAVDMLMIDGSVIRVTVECRQREQHSYRPGSFPNGDPACSDGACGHRENDPIHQMGGDPR